MPLHDEFPSLEPEQMPVARELLSEPRLEPTGGPRRAPQIRLSKVSSSIPLWRGRKLLLWRRRKPLKREAEVSNGLSSLQRWRPRLTSPFCALYARFVEQWKIY